MLNFFKVFFWGNLTSQSIIAVLLWLCAGAAFYELNFTIQNSKEMSPIMIGTYIISFILGSYIYSKGRSNQPLEEQIAMGISRGKSPALGGLTDLIVVAFLTFFIGTLLIASFPYLIYVSSIYTIYVIGVQFYKKKKLSVQN